MKTRKYKIFKNCFREKWFKLPLKISLESLLFTSLHRPKTSGSYNQLDQYINILGRIFEVLEVTNAFFWLCETADIFLWLFCGHGTFHSSFFTTGVAHARCAGARSLRSGSISLGLANKSKDRFKGYLYPFHCLLRHFLNHSKDVFAPIPKPSKLGEVSTSVGDFILMWKI